MQHWKFLKTMSFLITQIYSLVFLFFDSLDEKGSQMCRDKLKLFKTCSVSRDIFFLNITKFNKKIMVTLELIENIPKLHSFFHPRWKTPNIPHNLSFPKLVTFKKPSLCSCCHVVEKYSNLLGKNPGIRFNSGLMLIIWIAWKLNLYSKTIVSRLTDKKKKNSLFIWNFWLLSVKISLKEGSMHLH